MEHETTKSERFYTAGKRLLHWLERAGFGYDHPVAYFSGPILIGAAWIWFALEKTHWSRGALVVTFLFQAFLSYLYGAANYIYQDAYREVWAKVKELNTDTMGHLAVLLRHYRDQALGNTELGGIGYLVFLRNMQQHLLVHLVDILEEHLGLQNKRELSANWALPEEDDDGRWFRPRVYDRNMKDRQPSKARRYRIQSGVPGASYAFLTGELSIVHDTRDPEVREYFRPHAEYRNVLSFPVTSNEQVLGVVNVDALTPGLLRPDLDYLIRHIGYLIGLCESFFEEAHRRKLESIQTPVDVPSSSAQNELPSNE